MTEVKYVVIYSKSEGGKAFVHADCVVIHEAELSRRCSSSERNLNCIVYSAPLRGQTRNSRERKRLYSRGL
jgi:hypothetical protein